MLQANVCDPFGQGFHKADVTVGDDGPDPCDDIFVAHDVLEAIVVRHAAFGDAEIDVDSDALRPAFFVGMNADDAGDVQVSHKYVTNPRPGIGDPERLNDRIQVSFRRFSFQYSR